MMTETDFENNLFWNKYNVEGKIEEDQEFSDDATCRAIDERRRMEQRQKEKEQREKQEAEEKRQKEMQEAEERREEERKKLQLEMIRAHNQAFNALKQCIKFKTINYDMVNKVGKELSLFAQHYFVQLLSEAEELIKSREERIRRIEREIVELFNQKQCDVNRHFRI